LCFFFLFPLLLLGSIQLLHPKLPNGQR
jgi:hypothetical protein